MLTRLEAKQVQGYLSLVVSERTDVSYDAAREVLGERTFETIYMHICLENFISLAEKRTTI